MRRLNCTYVSSTSTIAGRVRVFGLIFTGQHISAGLIGPTIDLRNGSGSGDLLIQVNDNPNSYNNSVVYGSVNTLDLPSEGVLFPDGAHVTLYTNCKGVSVFHSGGA